MVLLVNPTAVESSIWIGLLGCGQPISIRVCWMNRAASLADIADAMTILMIWAVEPGDRFILVKENVGPGPAS